MDSRNKPNTTVRTETVHYNVNKQSTQIILNDRFTANIYGYIYLLQTRESIERDETIYKIGRTTQESLTRFQSYPKNSKLLLHIQCIDCVTLEKYLIDLFTTQFERCDRCVLYGKEYFNGDYNEMMETILNNINHSCELKYNKRIRAEYHKLEMENHKLEMEIKTLNDKLETRTILPKEENTENENETPSIETSTQELHVNNVNDTNSTICYKCNRKMFSKQSLKRHLQHCKGVHSLQCPTCNKCFKHYSNKSRHIKNVHCIPCMQ